MESRRIFRSDYRAPEFLVDQVELDFDLGLEKTIVQSKLHLRRNQAEVSSKGAPLSLNGVGLVTKGLMLDGKPLGPDQYDIDEAAGTLTIKDAPDSCIFEAEVEIEPNNNTELSGLYVSGGILVTQCESEGFRRITWYPDRPDVMSKFLVTLRGSKKRFPVLLSNGNRIAEKKVQDEVVVCTFEDPFPKPAYLFALVAGDLACKKDEFIRKSGRPVELAIYSPHDVIDRCDYAMKYLKNAMQWEEKVYGLEYDLDVYNIVTVHDFVFGAMENKGLNVFNSKYLVVDESSSEDRIFESTDSTIAHEYFHNWSGNRVTLKSWFELSLKEGLTVFRDQQYTEENWSQPLARIGQVNFIRTSQFMEDFGPNAHSVRPDSYETIDNFYTPTVYYKGAELIRMIQTIVGEQKFLDGCRHYFRKYDGMAVTIEELISSIEHASGTSLDQFRRWYDQKGTPVITMDERYDSEAKTFTLKVNQENPKMPDAQPLQIPLRFGLINPDGVENPLIHKDPSVQKNLNHGLIEIKEKEQTFVFESIEQKPIPSYFRQFSAPVKLVRESSDDEYYCRLQFDSDPVNRWDASQQLGVSVFKEACQAIREQKDFVLNERYVDAIRTCLTDSSIDPRFAAALITPPKFSYLENIFDRVEVEVWVEAIETLNLQLGTSLKEDLAKVYKRLEEESQGMTKKASGNRALKNACLSFLCASQDEQYLDLCFRQFSEAQNMTDERQALSLLVESDSVLKRQAVNAFYEKWKKEEVVFPIWFEVQALSWARGTFQIVQSLVNHPEFNLKRPSHCYSVFSRFAQNKKHFHRRDGKSYEWFAEMVIVLDKINGHVAASVAESLTYGQKYDETRRSLMRKALESIKAAPELTKNTTEIVNKALSL